MTKYRAELCPVQMEFELPLQLKQVLLHENDGIAEHNELPALPCKPCVADILSQYVDQSNSEGLAFEVEVCTSCNLTTQGLHPQ